MIDKNALGMNFLTISLRLFGYIEIFLLFSLQFFLCVLNLTEIDPRHYHDFIFFLAPIIVLIVIAKLSNIEIYRKIIRKIEWILHLCIPIVSIIMIELLRNDVLPYSSIPFSFRFFLWIMLWGLIIVANNAMNLDKIALQKYMRDRNLMPIFLSAFLMVWCIFLGLVRAISNPATFWITCAVFHSIMMFISVLPKWTNKFNLINGPAMRFPAEISHKNDEDRSPENDSIAKQSKNSAFMKKFLKTINPVTYRNEIRTIYLIFMMFQAWNNLGFIYVELGTLWANIDYITAIFFNPLFYAGLGLALMTEGLEKPLIGDSICYALIAHAQMNTYTGSEFILGYVLIVQLIQIGDTKPKSSMLLAFSYPLFSALGFAAFIATNDLIAFNATMLFSVFYYAVLYVFPVRVGIDVVAFIVNIIIKYIKNKQNSDLNQKDNSTLSNSSEPLESSNISELLETSNTSEPLESSNLSQSSEISEEIIKNSHIIQNNKSKNPHQRKINKEGKKAIIVAAFIILALISPLFIAVITSSGTPLINNSGDRIPVGQPTGLCAHPDSTSDYDDMEGLGVGNIRLDFSWDWIEPTNDNWNWGHFDQVTSLAVSNHINLIGELVYGNPAIAGNDEIFYVPPDAVPDYLDYVNHTVRRYVDSVYAWEIWNEPNHWDWWYGTNEEFFHLFNETRKLLIDIREEFDADFKIVSASTAFSWPSFFQQMWDANIMEGVDVLSVHPYNAMNKESIGTVIKQNMEMAARYNSSIDVWITEIGSATDIMSFSMKPHSEMGSRALKVFAISASLGVDVVTWYNLWDGASPENAEFVLSQYGIYYYNGTWKESAHAFSLFSKYCSNSTICPDLVQSKQNLAGKDITSLLYRRPNGDSVLMLWYEPSFVVEDSVSIDYDLDAIPGTVYVHDIDNSVNHTIESKGTIEVSNKPVFITFSVDEFETKLSIDTNESITALLVYILLYSSFASFLIVTIISLRKQSNSQI